MSTRLRIEHALWEINQGDFQRLGDEYLRRRGYRNLTPLGLAIGRQKTTTGTPDTYAVREDGKYVFVEYTTQENGVAAKFESDLKKCFDEEQSGVPLSRIGEVVLCHNGKLEPDEELSLRNLCESKTVQLTTVGVGELASDLVGKYPAIAQEFLGIDVNSGQILAPEDFVRAYGRSALATPLDTQFQFREKELERASNGLEQASVVLLTGRPGVGKSRLALEAARKYVESHGDTQIWCIFNRGADLFRELKTQFAEPGHYLLVVDDANRVLSFEYVLDLLRDTNATRTVKILASVRDYALEVVEEAAKPFGASEPIHLGPMTTDEIHSLIKQAHGITNPLFQERIVAIAEGSPRLALMAASLAAKEGVLSSLNDATSLYEEYFASIKRDIDALGDPRVVLVAGIVAFFRNVDRTHAEQMGIIKDTFGIDPDEFWATVRTLHELEVVDLYVDEVVRISDQVFATYLFYIAAFRDKSLDLSLLLTSCFPRFRQRLIEALNPVLSAFDAAAIDAALKPHVRRALEVFKQRADADSVAQLVDSFALLIPEEAFALVHEKIHALPDEGVPVEEVSFKESSSTPPPASVLHILSHFDQSGEADRGIAIELALAYLKKKPTDAPLVVRMLIEDYGMRHVSHAEGFAVQQHLVELLLSASNEGENPLATGLLLAVAEHQLGTAFHRFEARRGLTYTHISFHVTETPELRALRNRLWDALLDLAGKPAHETEVLKLIRRFFAAGLTSESKSVVAEDMTRLVPFFVSHLDPGEPAHAVLVHEFLETAERLGIDVDPGVEQRFAGGMVDLYELLTGSRAERRDVGFEAYQKQRAEHFQAFALGLNSDGVKTFLEDVERLKPVIPDHNSWSTNDAVARVLSAVVRRDPSIFPAVLLPWLQDDSALKVEPYGIVDALVERLGPEAAVGALTAADYPRRWFWLFHYCKVIPESQVDSRLIRMLLSGYSTAPVLEIPTAQDHLLKFAKVDPTIPLQVAGILEGRLVEDAAIIHPVVSFFEHVCQRGMSLEAVFKDDVALAKRLYLAASARGRGFDFDAASFDSLVTLDPEFPQEWIGWVLTNSDWRSRYDDSRDYTRLWLRPDAERVIGSIFNKIRESSSRTVSFEPYVLVFFRVRDDHPDRSAIWLRQDAWLTEMIRSHSSDEEVICLLFDVVRHLPPDRKLGHVATLLRCNNDINLFRSLPLDPSGRSWQGSAVPMYEAEIDFYNSMLSLCNSVALLQHKQCIRSHIEQLEQTVEREKKSDFMRD